MFNSSDSYNALLYKSKDTISHFPLLFCLCRLFFVLFLKLQKKRLILRMQKSHMLATDMDVFHFWGRQTNFHSVRSECCLFPVLFTTVFIGCCSVNAEVRVGEREGERK